MKTSRCILKIGSCLVFAWMICLLFLLNTTEAAETGSNRKVIKLIFGCAKPIEAGKPFSIARDIFANEISKRVQARTNYIIEWNIAFGGTLVKDGEELEATEMGLLDFGYIISLFEPAKLFLHNFGYWVPFSSVDVVAVNRIANKLFTEFPELGKHFEKYKQKYLAVATPQSFQLITTFPVKTLDDLKGKKIAAGGINLKVLPPIGAIPVQSAIGEGYTSLQAGVYSGWMISEAVAAGLKWAQVAPHWTIIDLGTAPAIVITVNMNTWNRLPKEVQVIIEEAAAIYAEKGAKEIEDDTDVSREKLRQMGAKIQTLDAKERIRWAKALPNLALQMAKEADSKGLPGTKLVKKYIEMQKQSGYTFPRDWVSE